jgi:hypothetical protein
MIEPESFTIRYTGTAQDAIDAAALVQPMAYHINTALYVLFPIAGLVLIVVGLPLYGVPAIAVGSAYLLLFRTHFGMRWWVRRKAGHFLGIAQKITLVGAGLQFESTMSSGQIPWSGFTEIRQSDRSVAFVFHGRLRAYIPVVAFASGAERDEVLVFARAQIAGAASAPSVSADRPP